MVTDRQTPCLYYICAGQCKKLGKQCYIMNETIERDSWLEILNSSAELNSTGL